MIVRIEFGDNDFGHYFERAAKDIYRNLCRGGVDLLEARQRAFHEFRELADKDPDAVVNMVLLAAHGHHLAQLGARRMFLDYTRLLKFTRERKEIEDYKDDAEETLLYWAKKLKVQFTKEGSYDEFRAIIEDGWENGEVVYIDFQTGEVFTR
jgi:hypothetical protein